MPEKYLKFDTEQQALDASHQALVYAGEYYKGNSTFYLWSARESVDGFWYLILISHPAFSKYETKALPIKIIDKLTDIEPVWVEVVEK